MGPDKRFPVYHVGVSPLEIVSAPEQLTDCSSVEIKITLTPFRGLQGARERLSGQEIAYTVNLDSIDSRALYSIAWHLLQALFKRHFGMDIVK